MATMFLSQHVGVRAIVAMTGHRYLSRFRAKAPVFAVTRHDGARRQMALMRDVFPINFDSRGLTPREAARAASACWWKPNCCRPVTASCSPVASTWKPTVPVPCACWKWESGRAIGLGDL